MSADAITVCPNCYAEMMRKPIDQVTLDDLQNTGLLSNALRNNYELYIDRGQLHVEFRACCWDCGYEAEVKMSASLGGSRPKERS